MRLMPSNNFKCAGALARFLLTAAVLVGVDLWTKAIAFERLAVVGRGGMIIPKQPYEFIPGWLEFTFTTNYGAVFGIGQGQWSLFVAVSVTAIVILVYLFAWSGRQWLYQFILGMLLAGVLGNLYDRVVFGYVRDMIHALPRWPTLFRWIFNIADSLLCTGVALMLVHSVFFQAEREKDKAADGVVREG
jgi:signal peptidase II